MARICYDHPYINVAQPSVLQAGSSTVYQPDFKPGFEIVCDSGKYKYLQANGAVSEGYLCKFIRSGQISAIANFDATPMNGTTSAAIPTDCCICVTSGGLADNQWGWFWLGQGEEFVYVSTGVASYTQLTAGTSSVLGTLAASGSGDNVADLICIDSTTSSGSALRLARSHRLLATNFVCSTA